MAFNWTMSWILRIFSSASQEAEKQGHDLSKEVKGQSDLVQEIFAHEAEKQGHDLIKEGEGPHDLSQEKAIDILKDWELTESTYSSNSSYLPKEKDRERPYSSEDSSKLSESTHSSNSSYLPKEFFFERTYSSEDSRKLSESIDSSNSSYVSKEKDCERPDSSEDSRNLSEYYSGSWYRKPQSTPSSDVVKIVRKKKNKKRPDSSGYEGQSEDSGNWRSTPKSSQKQSNPKRSLSSDFSYAAIVKQDTSFDKPSNVYDPKRCDTILCSRRAPNERSYAKSVIDNLMPSNYAEKTEDWVYNHFHRHNQSNKDFEDSKKTPNFRPVFIHGCNIGYEYGRKKFEAKGLLIAYAYFKDLGYKDDQIPYFLK